MGLIADIQSDIEKGAVRLIAEYRSRLVAEAHRLCENQSDVEDLVSRTLVKVINNIDSHDESCDFYAWMKSIMVNLHRDDLDRPVTRGTLPVDEETLEQCAGVDWSTDEQIVRNSDCEALRAALRDIPPEYKQTVILRFYEDLSLKEIASILNKPVGTIGRRIHVALHLLAGKLRAEFGKVKKPLAVLLAALLGVGALFGAWQTGLLDPLLSQKGEAYPPSEYPPAERRPAGAAMGGASCEAGAMRGESFPLQEETFQGGEAVASGEAESFPLQEETTSTQTQPQEKPTTTPVQVKEAPKVNIINKTATLAATAATSLALTATAANSVTIKNFDEDLATVYVNDEPTTNGQVVAVEGSVKIELKDFRNDYYFRFAPASQTDRTLALDCWEGVPAGYEKENPATFDVTGDLTITPNVDVKGYCWEYQEVGDVKQLTNDVYRWAWVKWVDANRTVLLGPCIEPVVPATANNLVVDFIERVRCNGKNYQVSTFSLANRVYAFTNSRAGTWAVPPRFSSFGTNLMGDSGFCITNVVGFYDIESCVVGDAPFSHAGAAFSGPATNFVPRNATSFGNYPYQSKTGMTGEVLMEKVTSIGSKCFYGCSGLTSLRITSPNLKSIANIAFAACTKMKDVTFAGSLANLTSIDASAFQSVVVTNFNFLVAPPASKTPLDNMLAQTTAGDGAHACRLTVDSSIAAWWALTAAPTEAELGVGLPENFMGVYVSDAGDRRAWIVSSTPVGGILLVGDMSMEGNAGFVPRTGLEIGSKLELKAPDGYDQCQLQHFVDGQWRTDKTISGTTVDYEHDGQLTRAVWSVDGAKLTKKVNGYGGAIDVTVVSGKEISEGIYEKGSVVRLTASGAAEHPTSHFAGWTKGIDAAQAGTATVEVTLDTDVEVTADFSPDEWIYTKSNATSGTLTDGEWTMSATKTEGELTINSASGGQNGVLWLDLALPVHDSENMEANYPITVLNCSPVNMRKMRVAPHFRAITAGPFMPNSTVLERIDGLGASQMTSFGYAFLYECGKCPLRTTVYEANDFVPPGLLTVVSSLSGVPYLTGTYELNAVTCLYKAGSINFQLLNDRLYYGTVDGHVVGVTNILLTTEGLQEIPDGIFGNARVEAVTIGSTNLTTTGTSAFKNYNGAFRSLTFLAHAPTVVALDNLVKVAATTNLTVYCSKFAPGWKDLRTKGYSAMEEWNARPAGCWGIYQTADGTKRYYLVQKDSKYDVRKGMMVLVK